MAVGVNGQAVGVRAVARILGSGQATMPSGRLRSPARYSASQAYSGERGAIPDGDELPDSLMRAERRGNWGAQSSAEAVEHGQRDFRSDETGSEHRAGCTGHAEPGHSVSDALRRAERGGNDRDRKPGS